MPRICEVGGDGKGLFFPRGGDAEAEMPRGAKIIIYGLALAWCFMGVAVISDVFMGAIEAITSKKTRVFDKEKQRYRTVKVWNETIANLTLLALGSSAPEILLNVVEVFKNEFHAGDLGPGTIVGSAAFNLFVISAVCVMAIPSPEHRLIKDVTVYAVTAVFSLFAYAWLLFVLTIVSKDIVQLWEAIITLLFFPVLVGIAFLADTGLIGGVPAVANRQRILAAEMTKDEIAEVIRQIRDEFGDLDDDTLGLLVEQRTATNPGNASRAQRRKMSNMRKSMTSASSRNLNSAKCSQGPSGGDDSRMGATMSRMSKRASAKVIQQAYVEWATPNYAIRESDGVVELNVYRYGNTSSVVTVKYRTVDGTAESGKDYVACQGTLRFEQNETVHKVVVQVLDDDTWEQAETFTVELFDAESDREVEISMAATVVTIIDDDDPGCLSFEQELVEHDADLQDEVQVKVVRRHGSKGSVNCKYITEDDTAKSRIDYDPQDDELTFEEGEIAHVIHIPVYARGRYECTDRFRLILYDPVGCRFDATTDGDEEQNICTIDLKALDESKAAVDKVGSKVMKNWDKARLGRENWVAQFKEAVFIGADAEDGEEAEAPGLLAWFFHIVLLPWKLMFATVPPPDFGGGWWCFVISLCFVGLVTAAVGDLAALFGCSLDMPDQVTAITFVALGTSLPDTFASKSAATEDPYADASITNITGSNSVNVFLGLGLPWTTAAIYWKAKGQTSLWREKAPAHVLSDYPDSAVYVLEASSLGFSVGVFTACAICALGALWRRRVLFGGELGGPFAPKVASSVYLVSLWLLYIAASWVYIKVVEEG